MAELRGSATLTVQSEYDGSYLKANAVDGNTSTEWATAGGGTSSWIQFDWASSVTIREIRIIARPGDNWGNPRFTFSDSTYSDGTPASTAGSDVTYVLLHPKTTTSLRISVAAQSNTGTGANPGAKEIYINDAYTTTPTTDLTKPDHLVRSSAFSNDEPNWGKWRAIDGSTGTEWASNGDAASSYITWEYLSSVIIESVQLRDRAGSSDRWGTPRFTYDDASYEDGGEDVSNTGYTTYTLTPKTTTSVKISIASGGTGNNRGFAEAILTGTVFPPDINVSESISVSESHTVQIEGVVADLEVSVSDSTSLSELTAESVGDTGLGTSDSVGTTESYSVSVSESTVSVSDSTTLSENSALTVSDSEVSVSDTVGSAESYTVSAGGEYFIEVSDSLSVSELIIISSGVRVYGPAIQMMG